MDVDVTDEGVVPAMFRRHRRLEHLCALLERARLSLALAGVFFINFNGSVSFCTAGVCAVVYFR